MRYNIRNVPIVSQRSLSAWGILAIFIISGMLTPPCSPAYAAEQVWQDAGVDDWYATIGGAPGASDNWSDGAGNDFVPTNEFEEIAVITNGGTAFVDLMPNGSAAEPNPGGIILGRATGETGSLEVRMGGALNVLPWTTDGTNGNIVVGQSGLGLLTVEGGGSIIGESISVGGAAGSSLIAGVDGSGTASVRSRSSIALNRESRITGPNVNVLADTNLLMGSSSIYTAEITNASSHSPLQAAGAAFVDGQFRVEFGGGVNPTTGSSWPVIDASIISGGFTSLDTSAAPALGAGQAYRLNRVSGGTYGEQIVLQVAQLLTLQVDRSTNNLTIRNQGGSAGIAIDGYSILSDSGSLNPIAWTSLQDAGEPGGWEEAAPTSTALSELRRTGATNLGPGSTRNLGAAFSPTFTEFGTGPAEDLIFEYNEADGTVAQGLVEYLGQGPTNNLLLTVDPSTGVGILKNDSTFAISLAGYSVLSDSGALLTSWNSLQDQAVPNWEEAAPATTALSELTNTSDASLALSPGESYNLGTLFNTAGSQDLELEFLLLGENGGRDGQVVFDTLPDGFDPDNDGDVDGTDFLAWQRGFGSTYDANDLSDWQATYGGSSPLAGATTSVPEPATWISMTLAITAIVVGRRGN